MLTMETDNFKLISFLNEYLKTSDFRILQLAGDASSRKYYRVLSGAKSFVLMSWEPFDPNRYPLISVLNHFKKNNVHTPSVLHSNPSSGLMLLNDLGDVMLETKFLAEPNSEDVFKFYQQSVDELIKIHFKCTDDKSDTTAFDHSFDVEKLNWELNFTKTHLLEGMLKIAFTPTMASELEKIYLSVSEILAKEAKYIVHRDYHSRNLMVKDDQIFVIDYQDARIGAVQYDLVSLIKDSYVNIDEDFAQRIFLDYLNKASEYLPQGFSKDHFDYIYQVQSIQRCFKACGSFASFYNRRSDTRYLKYLQGTLLKVNESLELFPEYAFLQNLLVDSGALDTDYTQL